ncbi:GNAT family N-acetyltransferase [Paeniglutamicibacter kerguelensis]|uniref:GNAT superfamily N-acetyltransferase n=2 Tax=Paeniglutamicibacter kerguelensis TaxID=254788 RepID=A0ABS4XHA5_9MICC|nr:GNAT family N-acetyltransferase [Paeniglutamicibacter kerguelensis]MBP2387853.1 GNAT superfamily N-acetyltransferase [Paeniglutamicibacter kerguelensis]
MKQNMETTGEVAAASDPAVVPVIIPANEASWADIQKVFGTRGTPTTCQCQWFQNPGLSFDELSVEELADRLKTQTACGNASAAKTSGLIAYLGDEAVGWCAVEPRTTYPRLLGSKVPWSGRNEDREDPNVWSLVCFVTRTGYRRRGVSRALAAAAVEFARQRGARALEGYPMVLPPGKKAVWGEMYVGSRSIFVDAGFTEVSHPTPRRAVMRIDFPTQKQPATAL